MTKTEIKQEIINEVLKRFPSDSELSERNDKISGFYSKTLPQAKLINETLDEVYNEIKGMTNDV